MPDMRAPRSRCVPEAVCETQRAARWARRLSIDVGRVTEQDNPPATHPKEAARPGHEAAGAGKGSHDRV